MWRMHYFLLFGLMLLIAAPVSAQAPIEKPVLVIQNGSTEAYERVAFSPDNKWLASSGRNGPVILWEAATGAKVREFPPVSSMVTEKIATGGITIWPVVVTAGGLTFSPDGKYIASTPKSNRDITNAAHPLTNIGNWRGSPPAVWEVGTGKPVAEGHWTVGEDHIAHNPNSPWAPPEVVAWQFTKDEATAHQFANYLGPAQTISANGRVGAARVIGPANKAAIEIYEVPSNRKLATLPGPFLNPYGLALSPDGKLLALKHQGYGIEVWDISTLKLVTTLDPKSWAIDAEAFSPDGKYLATAGDGDSVHIFETATWKELFSESYGQGYDIHEFAFSPDSKRLAGVDLKLHVWDVQHLREVYEIGGTPFRPVEAVAASPDGQRLAVARDYAVYSPMETEPGTVIELWPLRGGTPQVLPKKTYEIDEISFSPDSTRLAASGTEWVIRTNMHGVGTYSIGGDLVLWDLAQNREVEVKPQKGTTVAAFGPNVSFSSDGKKLVAGALVEIIPPPKYSGAGLNEEHLNASYRRLLMVIDPATGNTLDELRAGRGEALLLTQSPDGRHIISANEKTLRLWDLANHKPDVKFQPQLPPPQPPPGEAAPEAGSEEEPYQRPVVAALRYTPDGRAVLVAERLGAVWESRSIPIPDVGVEAVTEKHGAASLLDASRGALLKRGKVDTPVLAFAYSQDGQRLASAQAGAPPRLWDPLALTSRALEASTEDCSAIAFSADGATIVCGGHEGILTLWDSDSGSICARILRAREGQWLVITPEGLFDGTPEGMRLATWRVGNRSFTLDQLPKSFRREGLLQELFAGKRPKPKEDLASTLDHLAH